MRTSDSSKNKKINPYQLRMLRSLDISVVLLSIVMSSRDSKKMTPFNMFQKISIWGRSPPKEEAIRLIKYSWGNLGNSTNRIWGKLWEIKPKWSFERRREKRRVSSMIIILSQPLIWLGKKEVSVFLQLWPTKMPSKLLLSYKKLLARIERYGNKKIKLENCMSLNFRCFSSTKLQKKGKSVFNLMNNQFDSLFKNIEVALLTFVEKMWLKNLRYAVGTTKIFMTIDIL